jgi:hypothetical protein
VQVDIDKFAAPTLQGVDFPALGVYQAWNDTADGTLAIGTYAASPERQGTATSWQVTSLPNPNIVTIICDGGPFTRFAATGPNTIRIDTTIDTHQFTMTTGYRGPATRAEMGPVPPKAGASVLRAASPVASISEFLPSGGPGCPCCHA